MTQAGLAQRLGISASYLNLIEHDRRALTAPILIKLAQVLEIDLKTFAPDSDERTIADLMEVFGDTIFEGYSLSTTDVREFCLQAPGVAKAVLALYESFRELTESGRELSLRLTEQSDSASVESWRLPAEEINELLQRNRNYFAELETAAGELWSSAALVADDVHGGLVRHLQRQLGVEVRVVDGSKMPWLRNYDAHHRRLELSERLPAWSRTFQLAAQIALLESSPTIERIASDTALTTDESRALARVIASNYYAGAVMMPYERILSHAVELRYDVELLAMRFHASFEQVCHRLTTLQRPGEEAIPFHFVRTDHAGNISKRYSGSGISMARFSGLCPRWNVHSAFETPGQIRVQVEKMPNGESFLTIARTVDALTRGFGKPRAGRSVSIGCKLEHGSKLVYSDSLKIDSDEAVIPIGVTCRLCERQDCAQRALPQLQQPVQIDPNKRGRTAFCKPKQKP